MSWPKDWLWLDTETFCGVPIKDGTFQYAEACEIDLIAWAHGDAPTKRLDMQAAGPGDKSMVADMVHEARVICAHNCVTPDHEVLTPDGWVRFDALEANDTVAQWDPASGEASFTPFDLIKTRFDGDLVIWDTNFHQGAYTPNHRMYFSTPSLAKWRVEPAEGLAQWGQNNVYIPTAAVRLANNTSIIISAEEARLMEAIRADGSWHGTWGRSSVSVGFSFKKARKILRLKALLGSLGVTYSSKIRADGALKIWLKDCVVLRKLTLLLGKDKRYGSWVLELPCEAQQAILEETRHWDGSKTSATSHNISSADRETMVWLSTLAALNGQTMRLHEERPNTRGFSRPDSVLTSAILRQRAKAKLVSPPVRKHYSGDVFCVSVPTGAFLVRRNGATWITGNSMFDRNVLALGNLKLATPPEKWRCSMAHAMAHALPGSLDKLGEIMGVDQDKRKMKEGHALMMLFCKPRPKNHKLRRATGETHPEERARYLEYCDLDVIAMREVATRLPTWNMAWDYPAKGEPWLAKHSELAHWHRDQRMNAKGFAVDLRLAQAALRAVDIEQAKLRKQCAAATDGAVTSATQRDKLLEYLLAEYNIVLADMKGSTLEKVLADPEIDDGLRELLRIRLSATTTSTAKYKALLKGASSDGRLRGTIQMNGAGRTRRASGRTFQPQNLCRPDMPYEDIALGIDALLAGCEDML